jgi:AmmeMemoRadiSam system protein B
MGDVRAPAVAGSFYPSRAGDLEAAVRGYIDGARALPAPRPPKAVIAPHARYTYSGPVAGSAFHALAPLRGHVARVVLMGPAHRGGFAGLALPKAVAFATPLGLVRVDDRTRAALLELPQVVASDGAHADEHSLEVELPFLQVALGDVPIVPVAVGYTAKRIDAETADAIEGLCPDRIPDERACGGVGVRALLRVARPRGLHATVLDLRNSADTAGVRGMLEEVVGYGSFAIA